MLDRQKGNVVFECDGCDEVLETETSNFDAAVNMLNQEDWRSRKVGDTWEHYCLKCKKVYLTGRNLYG